MNNFRDKTCGHTDITSTLYIHFIHSVQKTCKNAFETDCNHSHHP